MRIENNIIYGPPGEKGISNISFGQYIFDKLRAHSNRTLQVDIDTGKSYTGKDILDESIRVAKILQFYGINVGDRVAIVTENHPSFLAAACGILYVGGIVTPLNPTYTEGEYRHMLDILQPRAMFVSRKTERILAKIAPTLSWTMQLIELDDESITNTVPTVKELSKKHANVVDPNKFVLTPITDTSKQVATILASSGTTGFPKGVALTHRNWMAFIRNSGIPGIIDLLPTDHLLLYLPLFHGYGFGNSFVSVCEGGTFYLMQGFSVDAVVKIIEKYKITYLPVVPPVIVALAKYPNLDKYDFSSLRQLVCGAAAFPLDAAKEISKYTKAKIRNGFGMTELTVVSHLSDERSTETYGMNILVPGFLCKIVDQNTGQALGPGQVGEICFKGDQIMLGYFGNPKATAETIDRDNWLHSGDLGYYNKHGELFITGRIKELIKYKGYQVSPSEVETIIQTHPGVKDAAVVGKPDENSGELPMAFVVKQPNSTVTAKEIIDFTNGQLSRHKWLRGGVRFINAIPKTPSGKVQRKELLTLISKI